MQTRSILGVYFTHLQLSLKIRYHAVCLNFQRTKFATVLCRHLTQPLD